MRYVIYSPSSKMFLTSTDWVANGSFALDYGTFLKAHNCIKNNSVKPTILNRHPDYEIFEWDGGDHLVQKSFFHGNPHKKQKASKAIAPKLVVSNPYPTVKVEAKAEDKVQKALSVNPSRKTNLRKLRIMETYTRNICNDMGTLSNQLSKIDKDIVDIQHSIEFYKYNAAEGYKAYKMLRDKLIERREIKKQMQIITFMKSKGITSDNLHAVVDYIANLDNEKYTPRNMPELFKDEDILMD